MNATAAANDHARALELRRLRAGELPAPERTRLEAHLESCPTCRNKLGGLAAEQQAFAEEISFERFAGGVERAARVPHTKSKTAPRWIAGAGLLLCAAAALVLVLRPAPAPTGNNLKGAAVEAELRLGGSEGRPQRVLSPGSVTRLAAGDRLRLGYRSERPQHLVVLTLDDAGAISPLYPEAGPALVVASSPALTYLPDAIALDGTGRERIFLVLGDDAFSVEQATAATRAAHAATRDLATMPAPALARPTTIFTWLLEKP